MNNPNLQQPSGFNCPVCRGFIPISIMQLIQSAALECPSCKLEIRVNEERSQKAIRALKKVKEAEENVRRTSVFKR